MSNFSILFLKHKKEENKKTQNKKSHTKLQQSTDFTDFLGDLNLPGRTDPMVLFIQLGSLSIFFRAIVQLF